MRFNNLFEHEESMKRHQAPEESPSTGAITMPSSNTFKSADTSETPSSKSSAKEKSEKSRHRASIACATCRDRRIRCVVPKGERECTQCKRSKTECIIKNDDERRRPISKAYMSSLTDRVALLEGMLQEEGKNIPPANYPPKTRAEAPVPPLTIENSSSTQAQNNTPPGQQATTPRSMQDGSTDGENGYHDNSNLNNIFNDIPQPRTSHAFKKEGLVHQLLSTQGHLSFDELGGRLRFYGPTRNCHIYGEKYGRGDQRELPEQVRRTQRIIRTLSTETHDYLMNLFWEHYNAVLHVIHEESFNEDMHNSQYKYYSGFLHISILAMGYRFADLNRPDMKAITVGNRECTLHREAKYMLDAELERPGGLPSVQAFLILGDLECAIGRDNVGWMYSGMANRLCFDLGLHLECQNDGLPEKERQIRHMTLFACVVYDKYWALFLGRPTGIKSADLEMYRLTKQFSSLSACKPAGVEKSLETQIYEELLDLMELAGKIPDIKVPNQGGRYDDHDDADAYMAVINLDRQLQKWYNRLPEHLTWKPANIQTAPFSFFLLHQQYHCSLILLHRSWARYEETPPSSDDGHGDGAFKELDDNHSNMSRAVCAKQAIRVARIFWHHRQRFDTKLIFCTGMQHAGTAATALVAALAYIKNPNDRRANMQYLECLADSLHDMSAIYQPAASMSSILKDVMVELGNARTPPPSDHQTRWLLSQSSATIPARRGSIAMEDAEIPSFKKRQLSRSSTRPAMSVDFARTPRLNNMSSSGLAFPESETDRRDGYVMVTPRSERTAWPSLTADLNALDYPMQFDLNGIPWNMETEMTSSFSEDPIAAALDREGTLMGASTATGGNKELDFFHF